MLSIRKVRSSHLDAFREAFSSKVGGGSATAAVLTKSEFLEVFHQVYKPRPEAVCALDQPRNGCKGAVCDSAPCEEANDCSIPDLSINPAQTALSKTLLTTRPVKTEGEHCNQLQSAVLGDTLWKSYALAIYRAAVKPDREGIRYLELVAVARRQPELFSECYSRLEQGQPGKKTASFSAYVHFPFILIIVLVTSDLVQHIIIGQTTAKATFVIERLTLLD